MLQTHLPSGRRRLLLLIIILFTVAVFGTRYLLLTFGWVGKQTDSTPEHPSKQTEADKQQESPTTFTPEQLQQAKEAAQTFIKLYTQHDLSQSEAWLQSFEAILAPHYKEELRLEVERSRPTVLVAKIHFQAIKRSTCQSNGERVYCYLEVTTEEINAQEQGVLVDKHYEVILSLQNGNWKVEGLNIHGSLD